MTVGLAVTAAAALPSAALAQWASPFTLSDLLARSWQYVLETPTAQGPWTGGNACIDLGTDHRGRPIVNPSAPPGTEKLECTVPGGTALFVTVMTSECSNLESGEYDFG
jgi:hypothetical protein